MRCNRVSCAVVALSVSILSSGTVNAGVVVVDYTVDAGGKNSEPLNGLAARATWDINGTQLTITLENTSTGIPNGFKASDQLVVSLGFNLPKGTNISSGDSALIAAGASGLGIWSPRGPGDSVAEEWLWTNEFGGDVMEAWRQIISTSSGQGAGNHTTFDGKLNGDVNGPFGGIAAAPPFVEIPNNRPAVSDGIVFTLTLSDPLTSDQLIAVANGSIVEFGSDMQYLGVPAPGAVGLLALAGALGRGRRRRG